MQRSAEELYSHARSAPRNIRRNLDAEAQHLQSIGKIPPNQKRDARELLMLFHAMLAVIRESLARNSQEQSFEAYRDVFANSRYLYDSVSWKFSDPALMRLLR